MEEQKQFEMTLKAEYKDRRKHPVMVIPGIIIEGIEFYCHHEIKESKFNEIAQILTGELATLEGFKVRRCKKYVNIKEVELDDVELADIRCAPSED